MTLVVDAPASYEPERRYILDVVLGQWLGIDYDLRLQDRSDVRIKLKGDPASGQVVLSEGLFAVHRRDWLTPASLPHSPLAWRAVGGQTTGVVRADQHVPVIYGSRPEPPALLSGEGSNVEVGVDVFGSAFFMLTRLEEIVVPARDRYGRFQASDSVAYREHFVGLPIVDLYTELLWHALQRAWPRLPRRHRNFRLSLTHDVDSPLAFLGHSARGLMGQLAADVLVRRDLSLVGRRLRSWTKIPRGDYRLDPYNTFDFLMGVSERQGLSSAFYFLATEDRSARNGFYTLAHPWIESLMSTIYQRGHEIGFHAGFDTYRDAQRTADEYRRLRAATSKLGVSQHCWGGRQHYLRWENPCTWSNWEQARLDYDSTPAFAEVVGFRFGTCHEFQTFDLRKRRPLRLRERPLVVMDASLFRYMKLSPDAAFRTVMALARQCRRYQGTLTLLWHNSSLPTAAQQRWYEALVQAVACPP